MSVQGKARIGAKELLALMTVYVVTDAFLSYPQATSVSGLEASWMEPLISGMVALLLFLLGESVIRRRFKGLDFIEIAKESFGPGIAVFIALLCLLYLIATTASVMRQFVENVITTVLPMTPIMIVATLFVASAWYVAYCGLEGIARASFILLPLLIVGFAGVCILTMNWWHPVMLLPFWGHGPSQVITGSFRYSSVFANVLLLCIIYPHAHDPKSLRRIGITSILLSAVLLAGFIAVFHMVFSADQSRQMSFHLYQLARMIYLGRFFQRMESVFIFLWVASAVLKMAFTLWGAAYLLASAFSWPVYRPILPAVALISFSVSLLPSNVVGAMVWEQDYLLSWGWVIVFALPLAVVLVGSIRRQERRGVPGV